MTDYAEPILDGTIDADQLRLALFRGAHAATPGSGSEPGWVAPNGYAINPTGTALDGFDFESSSTDLDVVFQTGEAIVKGTYVARDVTTTVTLPDGATTTVGVGPDPTTSPVGVYLGDVAGAPGPTVPLATYTTSGGAVDTVSDERLMGPVTDVKNQRYESTGATDADTFNGYGPAIYYRNSRSVTIPNTKILDTDTEPWVEAPEHVGANQELRVTKAIIQGPDGTRPTGIAFEVVDAATQTVLDSDASHVLTGTIDTPAMAFTGEVPLAFRLRNTTGSAVECGLALKATVVNV